MFCRAGSLLENRPGFILCGVMLLGRYSLDAGLKE